MSILVKDSALGFLSAVSALVIQICVSAGTRHNLYVCTQKTSLVLQRYSVWDAPDIGSR